jgi:hypothetical protein
MVGHQNITVDVQNMTVGRFLQTFQVKAVILITCKNRIAVVPPLDNMVRLSFSEVTG